MQMKEIELGGGGGFYKRTQVNCISWQRFFVHTLAFKNTYYLEESNTANIDKPRH